MTETSAGGKKLENRPWAAETYGLEPIPDGERQGKASDLFSVWFAANLGIIGVIYGAVLATFGLDLWQELAVATVGTAVSFSLVGALGVAGRRGGAPMLCLSRVPFGRGGNLGPTLASWASLLTWETITAVIAAYSLVALVHVPVTTASTILSLAAVMAAALLLGRLGHATILRVQRWVSWTVGALTMALLPILVHATNWSKVTGTRPGSWLTMLGGLSIVAASGGISWANLSGDYSRYLPRHESGRAIVGWTTLGSSVALVPLIAVGILLSSSVRNLSGAPNPVAAIGSALPSWLSVPFLMTAIAGLLAQMVMGLYSSGLNLLVIGVRIARSRTVVIDAAVVIGLGIAVMTGPHDFFSWFVSLVELLACGISAWAAVFLVDMVQRHDYALAYSKMVFPAVAAWVAGTLVGLACTSSPMVSGPLAHGLLATSSIGYLIGFATSAGFYAVLGHFHRNLRSRRLLVTTTASISALSRDRSAPHAGE